MADKELPKTEGEKPSTSQNIGQNVEDKCVNPHNFQSKIVIKLSNSASEIKYSNKNYEGKSFKRMTEQSKIDYSNKKQKVDHIFEADTNKLNMPEKEKTEDSTYTWMKRRKICPQNIVKRLYHRDVQFQSNRHLHWSRMFYQNITPNFTVTNVQKPMPSCFLRKFSPNGRYLIAFSADQSCLEIFHYMGPSAAGNLLKDCNDKIYNTKLRCEIEKNIFDTFFKLLHSVKVTENGERLNRECSLFTDDGKHVIIGSTSDCSNPEAYYYLTGECVTPNPKSNLENYTLHIIDLERGFRTHSIKFDYDKIFLSHNQGLYLYKQTLAVLSVQRQNIHICEITPGGEFVRCHMIGQNCYADDRVVLNLCRTTDTDLTNATHEPNQHCIYSLKQRILVFLYKIAQNNSEKEGNKNDLFQFYKHFDYFCNLRMWKMQLLDEKHLLIKYTIEDVVTLRAQEPNYHESFFVVYNMRSTNVIAIYRNTSEEFLNIYKNYADYFRNARLSCESQYTCSPANNIWARIIHDTHWKTIVTARNGGRVEAAKRLLGQLPISAQSFSASPFLCLDLFSYDDKWVSVMERPKNCADHPIRFYGRDSGLLKFILNAGRPAKSRTERRLVAFIFHPFDPFAISVQRDNDEYVVSFHLRHQTAHVCAPSSKSLQSKTAQLCSQHSTHVQTNNNPSTSRN